MRLAFFGVWPILRAELTVRTSDDSLKKYINYIYICEWAEREDWCSVGAVARWVVLPGRWYTTVMDIDGSDSLPPSSSNPLQNTSTPRSRTGTGTKSTRTHTANPMALRNEGGADAMEEDGVAGRGRPKADKDGAAPQNRRRRPRDR